MKSLHRSILLADYMSQVAPTDELPSDDLQPVLLGLFGEVGSIMSTAKKFHREKDAYAGYRHAVEEKYRFFSLPIPSQFEYAFANHQKGIDRDC